MSETHWRVPRDTPEPGGPQRGTAYHRAGRVGEGKLGAGFGEECGDRRNARWVLSATPLGLAVSSPTLPHRTRKGGPPDVFGRSERVNDGVGPLLAWVGGTARRAGLYARQVDLLRCSTDSTGTTECNFRCVAIGGDASDCTDCSRLDWQLAGEDGAC
jgi:hypothetical protein